MTAKNRVAVGMSGGIDSSVAAARLLEEGYEVLGLTLFLRDQALKCVSEADAAVAARIARQLGIEHEVVDARTAFEQRIVRRFAEEYARGRHQLDRRQPTQHNGRSHRTPPLPPSRRRSPTDRTGPGRDEGPIRRAPIRTHSRPGYRLLRRRRTVGRRLDRHIDELGLMERELKVNRPLKLYGQELTGSSYAIARMNMVIHDMEGEVVRGNSMVNPKFRDDHGRLRKFDIVVANPMWNQPMDTAIYEKDEFGRFVKVISNDHAAENDYNLSPSRYVDTSEEEEYRPIPEVLEELWGADGLEAQTRKIDAELKEIFEKMGFGI